MQTLSAGHERVLSALMTYRLASVKQLQAAGAGRDPKHLRELVRDLHRLRLVRQLPDTNREGEAAAARFVPGEGRRSLLYYLSPRGADAAAELFGIEPPLVKEKPYGFSSKVAEWEALVDLHIAARTWATAAGGTLNWWRADFEPGSAGLHRSTAMPYLDEEDTENPEKPYVPDALADLTLVDDRRQLLVVEVYLGGWRAELKHFHDNLHQLIRAAELAVPERAHGFDKLGLSARYLIVFKNPAMRAAAVAALPNAGHPMWGRFFFKSAGEVAADFNGGWWQPGRSQRSLF